MPLVFNVEAISMETGEETQFYGWTRDQVRRHLSTMQEGDELVLHVVRVGDLAAEVENAAREGRFGLRRTPDGRVTHGNAGGNAQ